MEIWMIYAVLAVISSSIFMVLQKVPSFLSINKYQFNTSASFFAVVIAYICLSQFLVFDVVPILFAALWGTGFTILNLLQMHALEKSDTSGVFPFTSLLSNVFVVIGGILFLGDKISGLQLVAIILALVIFGISSYRSKTYFVSNVLSLFFSIALISTLNKFVQKFGSVHAEIYNFIFWQLLFAFVSSLSSLIYKKKVNIFESMTFKTASLSLLAGVASFFTTFLIVKSLALGPISLVFIIIGTYTFFTSLLASIFFKEVLSVKKILFIAASILVIVLIKLG